MASETLTTLVVHAMWYYYRGHVKTADIKLNQAMAAYKKAQRLSQLEQN